MMVVCTRKAEARESVQQFTDCLLHAGPCAMHFLCTSTSSFRGVGYGLLPRPGGDRGPKSSETQEEGATGFWVQVCLTPQPPGFLGTAPLPR